MFVHQLSIPRSTMFERKVKGLYSLHKIVYSQFENIRTEEEEAIGSKTSGFVWKDMGGDETERKILIFSDREITPTDDVDVKTKALSDAFLGHKHYKFEVLINPVVRNNQTRKIRALVQAETIQEWFNDRCESWGFETVMANVGPITTHRINESGKNLKVVSAQITGVLTVSDAEKFKSSVLNGIGRSRTFGCGLLQITPLK